jgi:hypothetical protein
LREEKMKKHLILGMIAMLVVILTLTLVPLTLNADMEWKSATENLTLSLDVNMVHSWSNPTGENVTFVIVNILSRGALGERELLYYNPDENFLFSGDGILGEYPAVSVSGIGTQNIVTSFYYDLYATGPSSENVTIEYRWGQSIRTSDLVCQKVWVNEKGNFQFVFWYAYRDNNWVKIYDMNGKEVYSINMPYDNPQFEVSLPDGMYTVKTFSIDQVTPIQTFIIGK